MSSAVSVAATTNITAVAVAMYLLIGTSFLVEEEVLYYCCHYLYVRGTGRSDSSASE